MDILVPVDNSELSMEALSLALDIAEGLDATVDIVHFAEFEDEEVESLRAAVDNVLEQSAIDAEAEIVGDVRLSDLRASNRIGEDILELVEDRGYDHVVMGHHGSGIVDELLLGSAAETVIEDSSVPVTIVP